MEVIPLDEGHALRWELVHFIGVFCTPAVSAAGFHFQSRGLMKTICPKCGSAARPVTKAQAVGSMLGIAAGGLAALIASVRETSGYGPVERATAVILSVLGTASFGGVTGARVGKLLDEHVIQRYQCTQCGNFFRR